MTESFLPGISGFAAYVPPYRVDLQQWCEWTGADWDKTRAVVGHGFRVTPPDQSVYTMAAEAVLRLIERYEVDPARIGFLALGTESSSDNAAGTVIVRGLIDEALRQQGRTPLARDCEVPEFKHACLGGVYALKGALRYVSSDGAGRQAIVVCGDIAEYARGSSGEPTQGSGAVAMLVEREPKLLEVDLSAAGSASDYRILDFRKPFLRFAGQTPGELGRLRDFPVFNGKYSTVCYIDETLQALASMRERGGERNRRALRDAAAVFMHRPYHRMPVNALALGCLAEIARDDSAAAELEAYCQSAGVDAAELRLELMSTPQVADIARSGNLDGEAYPLAMQVLRGFRKTPAYQDQVESKLTLGAAPMMEMGNLYTAALPAWIAAGLYEAVREGSDLAGRPLLIMGYGSGDAAEAIPARVVAGWRTAAMAIDFGSVLAGAVDLTQDQYEALHDMRRPDGLPTIASRFAVDGIGQRDRGAFQDFGVELYRVEVRVAQVQTAETVG